MLTSVADVGVIMNTDKERKGRVLIVDDEIYIQEILKTTLEDAGMECVTAGNAEEALSALVSQKFDLAFLDLRLPGKKGTELIQEIRASYPNIAIIIVSGIDSASTAIKSIHGGG